jgi:hypothetical protein
MGEAKQVSFTYKEVAEALVKQHGISEGIWALAIEFGLGAANIVGPLGPTDASPAAIIPLKSIGLIRVEKEDNLSVDASKLKSIADSAKRRKAVG